MPKWSNQMFTIRGKSFWLWQLGIQNDTRNRTGVYDMIFWNEEQLSLNKTKDSLIFVFMVVEFLEISTCTKVIQIDFLFMCKMWLGSQLGLLTDVHR